MLSDTQKQNLSAIAKGRSRDSKGRLLPNVTAQESRIEELEKTLATTRRERNEAVAELQAVNLALDRLEIELAEGRTQSERIARSAQEQASISRVQFACTGLIISIVAAGLAFFVGRWAK